MNSRWITIACILLMVGAYHLAWTAHPTAAFTNNAFDLAEGVSLHPSIRAESPALYTPLLLRLPLVFVGMMLALSTVHLSSDKARWILRGIALFIVLRLNPPIDFYRDPTADSNYQQLGMLMFGGIGAIVLLIIFAPLLRRRYIYHGVMLVLVSLTLYVSVEGQARAADVWQSVSVDIETGGGLYVMVLLLGLVGGITLFELWKQSVRQAKRQDISHSRPASVAQ